MTITAADATNTVIAHKGETLILTLTDGTTVEGTAISVNTKGINLKDADGKVFTKALSKVDLIETELQYADRIDPEGDELGEYADPEPVEDEELDIDEVEDGIADVDIDDVHEGMSAAEVAAIFEMPAKDLRKVTRAMGLGVGRGRVYSFDENDVKAIKKELKVRAEAEANA